MNGHKNSFIELTIQSTMRARSTLSRSFPPGKFGFKSQIEMVNDDLLKFESMQAMVIFPSFDFVESTQCCTTTPRDP
jgi:hypothetical protein